jgi:DNA invertase Pin-like site-specific DNA recombinase
MSSFAEFERDMIVERTQEGKAIARQREDFREGRPNKYSSKQINHARLMLATHSCKEVEASQALVRAHSYERSES